MTRNANPSGTLGASPSWLWRTMLAMTLTYAFLAGLRTVTDYDLGWQLATGRWIVQHHQIPSTDVFSYTAQGQPWIYPIASCMLLYGGFLLGGYGLLSWLGAAVCVATVVLLLRRGSMPSAILAILVLPRIAARTGPRAEMFTPILFAAFLSLLWEHFSTAKARLWLLPVLMVAWVNLHLGFAAGLVLIAAYAGCEVLEMLFTGQRRQKAVTALSRAWPWFALTILATLINPWGWNIYVALTRQNAAMAQHGQWINEWAGVPLHWNTWATLMTVRDTKGVFVLLVAVAIVCAALAVCRRQPGAALLVAGAVYGGMKHVRLQALGACVVVVIGGWILSNAWRDWSPRGLDIRMRKIVTAGVLAIVVILAVVRSADLVTNRHYLGGTETGTFGTGLSWWFPERALDFVKQRALPKEVFNQYNTGGFLLWRLGPDYRDYLDGRAIPFGPTIFEKQDRLMSISPDSLEWQREVDRYGINTVVLSLARYDGSPGSLPGFCNSRVWSTIYLDEISAIFVRRTPESRQFVDGHELACATAPILRDMSPSPSIAFNQWANAALVLHVLGRQSEALAASDRALRIFPAGANLHFIRAKIYVAMSMPGDAEREYRAALALEPNDATWASLAELYQATGNVARSLNAMRNAVEISPRPHLMLVNLGYFYLRAQQPEAALKALDDAVRQAPSEATTNNLFQLDLARGRAAAWSTLGDSRQAIAHEEAATRIAPGRSEVWLELANLYELNGRTEDATRARSKAEHLQDAETSENR